MQAEQVIRRPLILTEKGTGLRERQNKYQFEVHRDANKIDIKKAVERLFKGVSVLDVNTMIVRGHVKVRGRQVMKKSNWKKAVVTLREGDKIDFFEGT